MSFQTLIFAIPYSVFQGFYKVSLVAVELRLDCCLVALGRLLDASWAPLGASWPALGRLWAELGCSWTPLGGLAALGLLLDVSWANWDASWANLDVSWTPLEVLGRH